MTKKELWLKLFQENDTALACAIHLCARFATQESLEEAASLRHDIAVPLSRLVSRLDSGTLNSVADIMREGPNAMNVFEAEEPNSFLQEDVDAIDSFLKTNDNIATYNYVSKEEALEEQMGYLGEYGELLESYQGDENPLPASFRCTVKNLADIQRMLYNIPISFYRKKEKKLGNFL